ncbi:AMP-binding protein [Micromonospora sp. b486]|uniref:AMP-binding protein n=1 Tax=Micromonospora sp. b486 TaxID=3053986 RepID=UPI00259D0C23|nr:AMP-binding protein [Micromonospora sp. b486]MDM4777933.1 AMP-binding protein [Micromonospora sp. b486]
MVRDRRRERYRSAGYWTGVPFGDLLHEWATRHAGRTALVDGERRWTYRQLDDDAVDRVCAGLRRLGLRRGDRVVVQLPNRAEFVEVWFALQRLGAVPVHAMPGHRYAEIAHLAARRGRPATWSPTATSGSTTGRSPPGSGPSGVPSTSHHHVVVVGDPGDSGFTA